MDGFEYTIIYRMGLISLLKYIRNDSVVTRESCVFRC